jgi:adenosylcobyric acid synthase
MGETVSQSHWLEITSRNGEQVKVSDGSISSNRKVWGCYIHGLFTNDSFRHAWLTRLGGNGQLTSQSASFEESVEQLADAVEDAFHTELLTQMVWQR